MLTQKLTEKDGIAYHEQERLRADILSVSNISVTPIHKTGHIYFVLLQKRTSTLKITRRQKSAHKFSPQFTPCTKAFGRRGRYVCDLASVPNSTCWWPGAESAQKEGHLYISTKKVPFLTCTRHSDPELKND